MNNQEKEYQNYLAADFIWDDDFRSWVKEATPLSDKFWTEWLTKNPDKIQVVESARQIILSLQVKETGINSLEVEHEIKKVLDTIHAASLQPVESITSGKSETQVIGVMEGDDIELKQNRYTLRRFLKIAAVFILTIGIGVTAYYYFKNDRTHKIESAYGTIRQVILPDSSMVMLNGNSDISFKNQWKANQPREIWLRGEGFFNVRHLNKERAVKPGERFIVHVNDINVEVLGTTFDIRERRNTTVIVLNTGSIKLSFKGNRPDIFMKPGDIVTISADARDPVIHSTTEPAAYSAWTEKKLILNATSVEEIFQYLEDNYGKKIYVPDPSVMNHKIEGTIMLDNLDDALFVLSKVLNANINYSPKDSSIIITPK